MAAKIEYEIIGTSNFLRSAEYGMYILNFFQDLEDKFLLAENVFVRFEESINPDPNRPVPSELTFSNDGKNITLVYKTSRFFQPKGGISQPSPAEFFRGLRYYLENTVIAKDNKKFKELNNK